MDKNELEKQKDRIAKGQNLFSEISELEGGLKKLIDEHLVAIQYTFDFDDNISVSVKIKPQTDEQLDRKKYEEIRWQSVCWAKRYEDFHGALHHFIRQYLERKIKDKQNELTAL